MAYTIVAEIQSCRKGYIISTCETEENAVNRIGFVLGDLEEHIDHPCYLYENFEEYKITGSKEFRSSKIYRIVKGTTNGDISVYVVEHYPEFNIRNFTRQRNPFFERIINWMVQEYELLRTKIRHLIYLKLIYNSSKYINHNVSNEDTRIFISKNAEKFKLLHRHGFRIKKIIKTNVCGLSNLDVSKLDSTQELLF